MILKKIKKIFILVSAAALVGFFGWSYYQYRLNTEIRNLERAVEEENFDFILGRYADLEPENIGKDILDAKRCYAKALALEKTGKSGEAADFWKNLAEGGGHPRYRQHALYYLGKRDLAGDRFEEAEKILGGIERLGETDPLFARSRIELARIDYRRKRLDRAVKRLRTVIGMDLENELLDEAKRLAGKINLERIYSRRITSNSVDYTIRPGDTLSSIAKQFNTTIELIQKTNNLSSSVIRPNNHLKIITSTFSIRISKSENELTVFENGKFFKSYPVGTGRDNVTPEGEFTITSKQMNPTWYRHDGRVIPFGTEENLLGTRWMSIDYPGYGIHGTWDDSTIGRQSSAGCVRLTNEDVEELFLYIPVGTPVEIAG